MAWVLNIYKPIQASDICPIKKLKFLEGWSLLAEDTNNLLGQALKKIPLSILYQFKGNY